jgi:hypothetical protein
MKGEPITVRWSQSPREHGAPEDQAGALLQALRDTPPPDAAALSRTWSQLAPAVSSPPAASILGWHIATGVVVATIAGGITAAVIAKHSLRPPAPLRMSAQTSPRPATAPLPPPPATVPPASLAAPPAPEELRPPAPRRAEPAPSSPPGTPASRPAAAGEAEDPLALEARLLRRAVDELRVQHDGRAALATLDEYRSRFPRGTLAREASVARVETLLALGRRQEALALLDVTPLGSLPRSNELGMLHAELLAEAGRCREALPLLEAELAAAGPRATSERALYGRGHCRASLGDAQGARADLTLYLHLYPQGQFAPAARTALGR